MMQTLNSFRQQAGIVMVLEFVRHLHLYMWSGWCVELWSVECDDV